MLRLVLSMLVIGCLVGCSGTRMNNAPPNVPSQASSVKIETIQMSTAPAAALLYAPKSAHGPILIALFTNRLALMSPIDGRTIQENTLPKRFGFPHLVYIQDQPLLMNSGDGFSDLYLMDLQGRILWTYEKRKGATELTVSGSGYMTVGDLDKDGAPEFYVSSMQPPKQYVHVLNKDGQFLRVFSESEGSIPCDYFPIRCQSETFIGATFDYSKRIPLLDFRAASGELKRRISPETDRLRQLRPLDWPTEGNYLLLDSKRICYVVQRDGGIVAKLQVSGTRLNHAIVTAANSEQEYLVLLSTVTSQNKASRLHVLNKNFSPVGEKEVERTWGICVASPDSKEFFLGGESGIYRCKLLE